jgi:hypothetical protein
VVRLLPVTLEGFMTSPSIVHHLSSSRLCRTTQTPELAIREEKVSADTVACCEGAFDSSSFFCLLAAGNASPALLQYVFLQYRFFRDQLHRWFGVCIMKAPSCSDPHQKSALMALADHVFTDLRDNHELMYDEFLRLLGIDEAEVQKTTPSAASTTYMRSFIDEFAAERADFYSALAALSGREICVSLRNRRLLSQYFIPRGLERPAWLVLHAELEVEHFRDAVRPLLEAGEPDAAAFAAQFRARSRAIEKHVSYFDQLLLEYEQLTTARSQVSASLAK